MTRGVGRRVRWLNLKENSYSCTCREQQWFLSPEQIAQESLYGTTSHTIRLHCYSLASKEGPGHCNTAPIPTALASMQKLMAVLALWERQPHWFPVSTQLLCSLPLEKQCDKSIHHSGALGGWRERTPGDWLSFSNESKIWLKNISWWRSLCIC